MQASIPGLSVACAVATNGLCPEEECTRVTTNSNHREPTANDAQEGDGWAFAETAAFMCANDGEWAFAETAVANGVDWDALIGAFGMR
jgi:hypothetical protein